MKLQRFVLLLVLATLFPLLTAEPVTAQQPPSQAALTPASYVEPLNTPLTLAARADIAALAAGDFNGDKVPDLVVGEFNRSETMGAPYGGGQNLCSVTVMLGDPVRRFRPPRRHFLPLEPHVRATCPGSILVNDFDRDGKTDIVAVTSPPPAIYFWKGAGDGTFAQPVVRQITHPNPGETIASDFDRDGILDLAVVGNPDCQRDDCPDAGGGVWQGKVGIFNGRGDGTFSQLSTLTVRHGIGSIAVSDMNSDGNLDVVTSTYGDRAVDVFLNQGGGMFGPGTRTDARGEVIAIWVGDFDGDKKQDVAISTAATASARTHALGLLKGSGDGTLKSPADDSFVLTESFPRAYTADRTPRDINGDGNPDIVFGTAENVFGVALGDGRGHFNVSLYVATPGPDYADASRLDGNTVNNVLPVDVNGDGKLDVVTGSVSTNPRGGSLGVALQDPGRPGSFLSPRIYRAVPGWSRADRGTVLADFNNDGKLDFAYLADPFGVMLGNGDGTFQPSKAAMERIAGPGEYYNSLRAADFDKDGKTDLVVSATGGVQGGPGPRIIVARGHGDGTFEPMWVGGLHSQDGAINLAVADLNKDGWPDIAARVPRGQASQTAILINDRARGFKLQPASDQMWMGNLPFYPGVSFLAVDLDGDGAAELLSHSVPTGQQGEPKSFLWIWKNRGDGTFAAPTSVAMNVNRDLALLLAADLNGDGKLDVIGQGAGAVRVYLGNGDGTLRNPSETGTYGSALSGALVDANADGRLDFVFASGDAFVVHNGHGDGTFDPPQRFAAGGGDPSNASIGDLNGDGRPDAVVGHSGSNAYSFTVLVNGRAAAELAPLAETSIDMPLLVYNSYGPTAAVPDRAFERVFDFLNAGTTAGTFLLGVTCPSHVQWISERGTGFTVVHTQEGLKVFQISLDQGQEARLTVVLSLKPEVVFNSSTALVNRLPPGEPIPPCLVTTMASLNTADWNAVSKAFSGDEFLLGAIHGTLIRENQFLDGFLKKPIEDQYKELQALWKVNPTLADNIAWSIIDGGMRRVLDEWRKEIASSSRPEEGRPLTAGTPGNRGRSGGNAALAILVSGSSRADSLDVLEDDVLEDAVVPDGTGWLDVIAGTFENLGYQLSGHWENAKGWYYDPKNTLRQLLCNTAQDVPIVGRNLTRLVTIGLIQPEVEGVDPEMLISVDATTDTSALITSGLVPAKLAISAARGLPGAISQAGGARYVFSRANWRAIPKSSTQIAGTEMLYIDGSAGAGLKLATNPAGTYIGFGHNAYSTKEIAAGVIRPGWLHLYPNHQGRGVIKLWVGEATGTYGLNDPLKMTTFLEGEISRALAAYISAEDLSIVAQNVLGANGQSVFTIPGPKGTRLWDELCEDEPKVTTSIDPNHLYADPTAFLHPGEQVTFTTAFENLPAATAPAFDVRVVTTIGEVFDPETFEVISNSRPDKLAGVKVDKLKRTMTWEFKDIELPPNKQPPQGEGWVKFRVTVKGNAKDGQRGSSFADIHFDSNPPLRTNTVDHAVDAAPPSSKAKIISRDGDSVLLGADATDSVSGVRSVLLVIENSDGSVQVVDPGESGYKFVLKPGQNYRVASIATDRAGNTEQSKAQPDLQITGELPRAPSTPVAPIPTKAQPDLQITGELPRAPSTPVAPIPTKESAQAKGGGIPVGLIAGAAVAAVLVLGGLAYFLSRQRKGTGS